MFNPLEFKHGIAGQPYRLARRIAPVPTGSQSETENLGSLLIHGIGAAYTAGMNLAAPLSLIQAGVRGDTYFTGLAVGYSKIGYPMPLFNYVTPASAAERFGARVGGRAGAKVGLKAGAKVGARIGGRLIPGVGWALLAYDVYEVAVNRSLWGFDLD